MPANKGAFTMPDKRQFGMTVLLLTTLTLIACGLLSAPTLEPAPIQPTNTSAPPTNTPTQLLPSATLPPPSPRPTITPTPAPEWVTNFAEPILAEISSRPPDLEDNFSHDTGAWIVPHFVAEWRKSIKGSEMIITGGVIRYQGINFHDYAVEVKAREIESGNHGIDFANYYPFQHPPSGQGGISCNFQVWDTNTHFGCSIDFHKEFININKEIIQSRVHTFLLIVKGGRIATYLDGKSIGYFEDDRYRLYRDSVPYVGLFSDMKMESVHAFSEFKVWNITKLEVP
jgi:hypothetical protein